MFWQYDALNHWKIKEICKQKSYNKYEQNLKTNKIEKIAYRASQT